LGSGIIDLILTGKRAKALIEVKIAPQETRTKIYGQGWIPQVRKYLSYRYAPVAFLTTRNVPTPDVNSRYFLGHFLLEDLHGHLDRNRLSATGLMLIDFMEENNMKALDPFTKAELRHGHDLFNFAKKCQALIDEVVTKLEPKFRKIYRARSKFTSPRFSPASDSISSYTKRFRYGDVRYVSIYLSPWRGQLGFGLSVTVPRKDIARINRNLGWEEEKGDLYTWHVIRSGTHPEALVKKALSDARSLRTVLRRVYY